MVMSAYSQSLIFLLKFAKSLFLLGIYYLVINMFTMQKTHRLIHIFFFFFYFRLFGVYSQHSVDRKAKAFYTHSMTEQNCYAK